MVDNDPTDIRTLLKIGDLQAKLGNIEAANDTYRKVGEHYAKDGFFLKAVAVFKQILKLDPGLITVYIRLAELYQQLGLNSEAMKQYQVVVRHYENKGLKKESLDVLRKMSELDPENTSSKIKLAELYAREGHKEAATDQFKAVTEDLRKKNNFQDLARVFEKMDSLGMADSTIKLEQAEMYLKTAEPKRALTELQALFQQDPKHPPTLELLARSFLDLQQPEKAKSVYKELVAVLDAKGMLEERDRIMAKLRALGVSAAAAAASIPSAPSTALRAEASKPAPPPAAAGPVDSTKVLGEVDVLLQYGLVDKACETLVRIVMSDPENESIRKKLISVYLTSKDVNALGEVLNRAAKTAESRKQNELVNTLRAEMASLGIGAAAPSTKNEAAPLNPADMGEAEISNAIELEIVDDEASAAPAVEASPEVSSAHMESEFERPVSEAGEPSFDLDASEIVEDGGEEPGEKTVFEPQVSAPAAAKPVPPPEVPTEDVDAAIHFDLPDESFEISSEPSAPVAEEPAPVVEDEAVVEVQEAEEAEAVEIESAAAEAEPEPEDEEEESGEEPVVEETRQFRHSSAERKDHFTTDMEEAAYFVQQGLLDEAIELYEDILSQDPKYSPAAERLAELRGVKPARSSVRPGSSEPERRKEARPSKVQLDEVSQPKSKSTMRVLSEKAKSAAPKEDFFDLSSELQDEISDLEAALDKKKSPDEEEYLSPEEVISEFKKGVARTLAKDDYQTHYNLGIAYREMGLLDEAIAEFRVAFHDPKMSVHCASMIGLCLVGKRDFSAAIENYRRALAQISPQSVEALGLNYELAEAHIASGNLTEGYKLFARIRDVDPAFRDVRRRAKELEADLGSSAPPHSAPEKPAEPKAKPTKVAAEKGEKEDQVKIRAKKTKISYI